MTEISFKYGFPLFSMDNPPINFNRNKILSTDIWAFWDYAIKRRFSAQKDRNIPQSLLSQAKTFYLAAQNADTRSKPLLFYYSFLNFGKLGIYFHNHFTKSQRFDHGIEAINGTHKSFRTDQVKVKKMNSGMPHPTRRSSCYEVVYLMEANLYFLPNHPLILNVKELLKQCIGVHRAYSNVYGEREIFVNLKDYKLYKNGSKLIFESYFDDDITNNDILELSVIYDQTILNAVSKIDASNKKLMVEHRCSSASPRKKDYTDLSYVLRTLGVWYYIDREGYNLYLSKKFSYRYAPESTIYMIMFYLGSITRYHPYLFDDIFSERDQWVISEFLATQPKQFLYLFTSKIFGTDVLEPKSNF